MITYETRHDSNEKVKPTPTEDEAIKLKIKELKEGANKED